jgi:hypothetical protein
MRRALLCALLAGASLAPSRVRAANPFVEPESPAPTAAADANPADTRMPPGTPSQVAASVGNGPMGSGPMGTSPPPSPGGSTGPGQPGGEGPGRNAQMSARDLLDSLGISSIVGQRVLFRLSRGTAQVSGGSGAGYSGSGNGSGMGGGMGAGSYGAAPVSSAGGQIASYSLVRAHSGKAFLLGQEVYVPVVDGFTVTLYRAADKDQRNPVWVGEPTPQATLVLSPSGHEHAVPLQAAQPVNQLPPAVMPSAAFNGAGAGASSGAGGLGAGLGGNAGNGGSGSTGSNNGNGLSGGLR